MTYLTWSHDGNLIHETLFPLVRTNKFRAEDEVLAFIIIMVSAFEHGNGTPITHP